MAIVYEAQRQVNVPNNSKIAMCRVNATTAFFLYGQKLSNYNRIYAQTATLNGVEAPVFNDPVVMDTSYAGIFDITTHWVEALPLSGDRVLVVYGSPSQTMCYQIWKVNGPTNFSILKNQTPLMNGAWSPTQMSSLNSPNITSSNSSNAYSIAKLSQDCYMFHTLVAGTNAFYRWIVTVDSANTATISYAVSVATGVNYVGKNVFPRATKLSNGNWAINYNTTQHVITSSGATATGTTAFSAAGPTLFSEPINGIRYIASGGTLNRYTHAANGSVSSNTSVGIYQQLNGAGWSPAGKTIIGTKTIDENHCLVIARNTNGTINDPLYAIAVHYESPTLYSWVSPAGWQLYHTDTIPNFYTGSSAEFHSREIFNDWAGWWNEWEWDNLYHDVNTFMHLNVTAANTVTVTFINKTT